MSKEMIISTSPHETKIALVEEGQVVEVYVEREKEYGLVGSIYKGRVTRVLPGMQSAFVDIGLDRDAFLYVSDFFEGLEEYEHVSAPAPEAPSPSREEPEEVSLPEKAAESEAAPDTPPLAVEEENDEGEPQTQFIRDEPPLVLPERRPERRGPSSGKPRRRGRRIPRDRRDRNRLRGRDRFRGRPRLPAPRQPSPPHREEQSSGGLTPLPGESLAKYRDHDPNNSPETHNPSSPGPLERNFTEEANTLQPEPVPEAQLVPEGAATGADGEVTEPIRTDQNTLLSFPSASAEGPQVHEFTSPEKEEPAARAEPEETLQGTTEGVMLPGLPVPESAEPEPGPASQEEISPPAGTTEQPNEEDTRPLTPEETEAAPGPEAEAAEKHLWMENTPPDMSSPPGANEHREEGNTPGETVAPDNRELGQFTEEMSLAEYERVRRYEDQLGLPPTGPETPAKPVEAEEKRVPRALAGRGRRDRGGRGRGRGRRRRPDMRHRGQPPRRTAARPSRGQPAISELLKAGQEIIVQIAKEQIAKKGARITSHITLPGRFIVYMPSIDHIGISRRIGSVAERSRLRRVLLRLKGSITGGFVVRTAASGSSEEDLQRDMDYLVKLWHDIRTRSEERSSPALLHRDLNLIERLLRDQLTTDYATVWIDNEEEYAKVVEFVGKFQPELVSRIKLYTKETPLFEEMGVQQEIERALRPKVWLKSGGYIVVNHTEALVAIDVNTGKFVGKGSTRLEDTIVKTNIEAIKEIVRQIRLRDLGGIIIIDFIDMEDRRNRFKVMRALEEALQQDRSPSKILSFNEFGLVAITRKRSRQSLERILCQPCVYCAGSGMVKSIPTLCIEIQNEVRKMAHEIDAPELTIRAHPDIVKALKVRETGLVREMEEQTGKNIILQPDNTMHFEQYNIY